MIEPKIGTFCQWGKIDHLNHIAPGILFVSTPSHGGFLISAERLLAMPEKYRRCSYTKDHHFEEDCSWCAVVLTWPKLFKPEQVESAQKTFDAFYTKGAA